MPPKKSNKAEGSPSAKAVEDTKKSTAEEGDKAGDDSKDKPSTNGRKRAKPEDDDNEDEGKKAEPRRSARQASQPKQNKADAEPPKKKSKTTTAKTKAPNKAAAKETKTKPVSSRKKSAADEEKDGQRPPPGKRASQPAEDEHGSVASKDRLPEVGQTVYWRAMPGMVEGKVLEILKTDTTVGGKSVRASEESPQLRLESSKSGKECVHKIDNIYFKDV